MAQNYTYSNGTFNGNFYDYEDMDYATLRHSLTITTVYCVAYAVVFVIGLVGNVLVMMVVLRTRIMKTTVFYFLFNLALADLLVIIFCVPATLIGNVYTGEFCWESELTKYSSFVIGMRYQNRFQHFVGLNYFPPLSTGSANIPDDTLLAVL